MINIILKAKKINNQNFKKFGEVINFNNNKYKYINNGFAKKFDDLAKIKILKNSGKIKFSIFKSKPRKFPLKIEMLERHPMATQLFFPISKYGFIVVVCANRGKPIINKIESFIIPPNTGINYKIGIWHYPLITKYKSNFIVIDLKSLKKNIEIFKFNKQNIILNDAK